MSLANGVPCVRITRAVAARFVTKEMVTKIVQPLRPFNLDVSTCNSRRNKREREREREHAPIDTQIPSLSGGGGGGGGQSELV